MTGAEQAPHDFAGYRLLEELGRGSTGVVHRARHPRMDRDEAVKVVHPWCATPELQRRFQRAAAIATSVEHTGLVTIYDQDEHDGRPYLAMELVPGTDLARLISSRVAEGAPDPGPEARVREAVVGLSQVADALDALHAAGLLHLGICPAKVLVPARHAPEAPVPWRLTGFGAAQHVEASTEHTGPGGSATTGFRTLSSMPYTAPELLDGAPGGPASDVYAFAATAWHLLAAEPPFGTTLAGVALAHQQRRGPRAPEHLPRDVARVLAAGLSTDPTQRPLRCSELVRDLSSAGRRSSSSPERGPRPRRRLLPAVALVGVGALLGAGGALSSGVQLGSGDAASATADLSVPASVEAPASPTAAAVAALDADPRVLPLPGGAAPFDVAVDRQGRTWVDDARPGYLVFVDPGGTPVEVEVIEPAEAWEYGVTKHDARAATLVTDPVEGVWVAEGGALLHVVGTEAVQRVDLPDTTVPVSFPVAPDQFSVGPTGEVWAVRLDELLHFDGTQWESVSVGEGDRVARDVVAAPSGDVFVLVQRDQKASDLLRIRADGSREQITNVGGFSEGDERIDLTSIQASTDPGVLLDMSTWSEFMSLFDSYVVGEDVFSLAPATPVELHDGPGGKTVWLEAGSLNDGDYGYGAVGSPASSAVADATPLPFGFGPRALDASARGVVVVGTAADGTGRLVTLDSVGQPVDDAADEALRTAFSAAVDPTTEAVKACPVLAYDSSFSDASRRQSCLAEVTASRVEALEALDLPPVAAAARADFRGVVTWGDDLTEQLRPEARDGDREALDRYTQAVDYAHDRQWQSLNRLRTALGLPNSRDR